MAPAPRTPEINAWLYSAGPSRVDAIRKRHAASSRVEFGPSTRTAADSGQTPNGTQCWPFLLGILQEKASPSCMALTCEQRSRCDIGPKRSLWAGQRRVKTSADRHPFSCWPSRCPPTRNTRTGRLARLASGDPWTAEPLLAQFGWLTFPLWLSQDPALDATPGECPRIMIDAPRICQDLSCSRMGVPPLEISLPPVSQQQPHQHH